MRSPVTRRASRAVRPGDAAPWLIAASSRLMPTTITAKPTPAPAVTISVAISSAVMTTPPPPWPRRADHAGDAG